ncbi:unnamed protein product [Cyprideis torosa]|uniref:Uncharacterized protein n=1 Tax=Cyprideis torosa TaxID=163714 RepID=A0A7R8WI80_9CRUS|nr:unnamed protein product [Cyprideis torosa]CAG0900410.1 unnamed protein product [Cyprideis torosa]
MGLVPVELIREVLSCDKALHYGTFDLPKICTSRFNYKRGGMMSEFSSGNGSFNMSNDSFAGDTEVAFDNLYPAVIECFIIIISGYFAGKFSIIKDAEANGINAFVGYFALPALIFKSMAQLDFSAVDWYFLLALTLAKGLIFFAVVVVTGLVAKTQNIGKAGLFGIFCTQSNDFALGYPIVVALYKNHHPELPAYLYLLAPISLVLLNPIGFLLMEFQKKRDEKENAKDGILFRKIFAGVALNPVVIMTVLGIVANVIFDKVLPPVLEGILTV